MLIFDLSFIAERQNAEKGRVSPPQIARHSSELE
nr:MAG TPA: hypothetical protein [Caudoviricetes sp.]